MEDLVLSVEQSKHLQELGLDMSDAKLWWYWQTHESNGKKIEGEIYYHLTQHPGYQQTVGLIRFEYLPTYTLQEILEKLPTIIVKEGMEYILGIDFHDNCIYYEENDPIYTSLLVSRRKDALLNSAYEMLCWVIENGYLKTNK